MSGTTPRTGTNGEVVGKTEMDAHVRDNFNETAPAKATTAGGLVGGGGTNQNAAGPKHKHATGAGGDVVSDIQSIAGAANLDFQPAAGVEVMITEVGSGNFTGTLPDKIPNV